MRMLKRFLLVLILACPVAVPSPVAAASPEELLRGLFGIGERALPRRNARPLPRQTNPGAERALSRDDRERIQAELNRRGFSVGEADGAFGRGTRAGIARYQSTRGEPATGALTDSQIADLLSARATLPVATKQISVDGFELLAGADLPGNDLGMFRETGQDACQALCAARAECAAFTHNTAKNVCFLKSEASHPAQFSGAVSGRKSAGLHAGQGQASSSVDFHMRADTDLPGGDYRSGFDDPALKDVSQEECRQQCGGDQRCRAFTYNSKARMCFLKERVGAAAHFIGAVTGVRNAAGPVVASARRAELAWRENDTKESFVARIRAAAKEMGGDCGKEREHVRRLSAGTTVTPGASRATAGQPIAVSWQHGPLNGRVPAWLIVAAKQPVRFKGKGFYALMPNAIGPFGIEAHEGSTRAMVALFGTDLPLGGTIEVIPLESGRLDLEWSVAGYLRACEEVITQTVSLPQVAVDTAAEPQFFVSDPFSLERPEKRLASADGRSVAEIFPGRYRLVDRETGAVLADRSGTDVNFSPTGRFLAARSDDGMDVLDAVDGTALLRLPADADLGWENSDSFAVAGAGGYGIVTTYNALVEGLSFGGSTSCRICPGGVDTSLRIDLENDVAHVDGFLSGHVERLSASQNRLAPEPELSKLPKKGAEAFVRRQTDRFVAAESGIGPIHYPEKWDFRGGLRLSHVLVLRSNDGGGDWDQRAAELPPHLVMAEDLDDRAQRTGTEIASIGTWRGAAPLMPRRSRTSRLAESLAGFGLGAAEERQPERFENQDYISDGGNRRIADSIRESVPNARNSFGEGYSPSGCSTVNESGDGSVLEKFDQAFHFDLGDRHIWITLYSCVEGSAAFFYENFYLYDSTSPSAVLPIDGDNPDSDVGTVCFGSIGYCSIDLALYDDRLLLIWSEASRGMIVVDIDSGRTIFKKFDLPRGDLLQSATMTADLRHVLQTNSDGSFFVFRIADGEQVLQGRSVDDEVVIWAPDLRFTSTSEGANYVNIRFPGQRGQYTFEQFRGRLGTDGLVEAVLGGTLPAASTEIGVPPRLSAEIAAEGDDRIRGRAELVAEGRAEIRIFQDGLLTDTLSTDASGADIDIRRLNGARWVSLVAVDERGLASLPVGLDLGATGNASQGGLPRVRLLAVGVDAYRGGGLGPLAYAAADASTLGKALEAQDGVTIALEGSTVLPDKEATPEAILAAAARSVEQIEAGDTLAFFFAGHGLTGPDGRFYMATAGTDTSDIPGTALAWDDLATVLNRAAGRVLVFLDACHSGTAGTGLHATNDDAAADVLAAIPSGLVVLSASKGRQFSEESASAGGGVFTNAVADVIARQRAAHDLDGNGAIEVSELYAGVKRLVMDRTAGRQTPWLARNQMVGDFALF